MRKKKDKEKFEQKFYPNNPDLLKLCELYKLLRYNEEIQQKLKEFESFVDKKYWDEDILIHFEVSLLCGYAETMPEAIKSYEQQIKQN